MWTLRSRAREIEVEGREGGHRGWSGCQWKTVRGWRGVFYEERGPFVEGAWWVNNLISPLDFWSAEVANPCKWRQDHGNELC